MTTSPRLSRAWSIGILSTVALVSLYNLLFDNGNELVDYELQHDAIRRRLDFENINDGNAAISDVPIENNDDKVVRKHVVAGVSRIGLHVTCINQCTHI